MKLNDIDDRAVRRAIESLPDTFRTKDVSRQALMLDAHGGGSERNYHALVGRYLSEGRTALGIRLTATSSGDRGAHWEKVDPLGSATPRVQEHTQLDRLSAQEDRTTRPSNDWMASSQALEAGVATGAGHVDLGPQYGGDRPFTARMRRHQSWYRATVLGVPYGTGPGPDDTGRYGNMLRREDGARGLNFLTPAIHRAATARVAQGRGTVEPFRLLHNMLSSQPMCFNLLAPLSEDLALATKLIGALLPGKVARVREVLFEWAPDPAREYLNDRTAFDAFVTFERPDGALAFVGIETKLTEPFSAKSYDGPAYRRWMELPGAPWHRDAHDRVADIAHNQLWRDHLLAWSLLQHPRSQFAEGRLMLIRHPLDTDCARIASRYGDLLEDGRTFVDMPLDRLLAAWKATRPADPWIEEFGRRYVDLAPSA